MQVSWQTHLAYEGSVAYIVRTVCVQCLLWVYEYMLKIIYVLKNIFFETWHSYRGFDLVLSEMKHIYRSIPCVHLVIE